MNKSHDPPYFKNEPSSEPSFLVPSATRGRGGLLTGALIAAWPGCIEQDGAAGAKLSDGNNLFLHQRVPGGKIAWRVVVSIRSPHGKVKQKPYTIGRYPDVPIAAAREEAEKARRLGEIGVDPKAQRANTLLELRLDRSTTFGAVAELWFQANSEAKIWSKGYEDDVRAYMNNRLKSCDLWKAPMATASTPVALGAVERVAQTSVAAAYKVMSIIRWVARHAVQIGCITYSPLTSLAASPAIRKYRKDSKKGKRHLPAILELTRLGKILRDNDNVPGVSWPIRLVHRWIAHTACRIANAVALRWTELDLEEGVWRIPIAQMKNDDQGDTGSDRGLRAYHEIPLATQMVAMLRGLDRQSEYVFFSLNDKSEHITSEGVAKHLARRLGLQGLHSPHSWRSSLSTWANDQNVVVDGRGRTS